MSFILQVFMFSIRFQDWKIDVVRLRIFTDLLKYNLVIEMIYLNLETC